MYKVVLHLMYAPVKQAASQTESPQKLSGGQKGQEDAKISK